MRKIAEILLNLEAVTLSPKAPYTWASGIKSPIYCDNRIILSHPKERRVIEEALKDQIVRTFPEAEGILGTATAGIPHASILAWEMDLPGGFIRSKAKDHGKNKQIEGCFHPGQKVVIIEDLISTGGSSIDAAKAAREAGLDILGIVSIFTYDLEAAEESFKEAGFRHDSLTNFPVLMEVAQEKGILAPRDIENLNRWRVNPRDESWIEQE